MEIITKVGMIFYRSYDGGSDEDFVDKFGYILRKKKIKEFFNPSRLDTEPEITLEFERDRSIISDEAVITSFKFKNIDFVKIENKEYISEDGFNFFNGIDIEINFKYYEGVDFQEFIRFYKENKQYFLEN